MKIEEEEGEYAKDIMTTEKVRTFYNSILYVNLHVWVSEWFEEIDLANLFALNHIVVKVNYEVF
jgi:hypothetical protein